MLVVFLEKLPLERPQEFLPRVEDYGYLNVGLSSELNNCLHSAVYLCPTTYNFLEKAVIK